MYIDTLRFKPIPQSYGLIRCETNESRLEKTNVVKIPGDSHHNHHQCYNWTIDVLRRVVDGSEVQENT